MDSIFGIGVPELIIILLLAGVIMGPQRIRQVAYTLGRITAQLQRVSKEFTRQLNAELDSLEDDSVRETLNDVRQLQKEVAELRRELARAPRSLQDAGKQLAREAEDAFRDTAKAAEDAVKDEPAENPAPNSPAPKSPLPKAVDVPGDPE
jgi:Sec-independent protein translocase protein TatA